MAIEGVNIDALFETQFFGTIFILFFWFSILSQFFCFPMNLCEKKVQWVSYDWLMLFYF